MITSRSEFAQVVGNFLMDLLSLKKDKPEGTDSSYTKNLLSIIRHSPDNKPWLFSAPIGTKITLKVGTPVSITANGQWIGHFVLNADLSGLIVTNYLPKEGFWSGGIVRLRLSVEEALIINQNRVVMPYYVDVPGNCIDVIPQSI